MRNYSEENRNRKYGKVWKEVFARDGGICVLCGSSENVCIDHVLSVKCGGKSILDNMRLLCRSCNTKEGHKQRKLSQSPKHTYVREYMKKWKENHKKYFTLKSREFNFRNPGYHTESQLDYLGYYLQAK